MGNSESKPEHSQHGVGESKDTGSIDRTTPTSPHAIPDKDSTTNSTGDVSDISGSQKMFVTSISPHDAIIYPPTTNPDKEKTLGKKEFEEKEFIDRINPTQNQDILMTVSDEVAPPGEIFCGGILTPSPKRRPETDLFPSIVNDIAAIPVNASLQLFHMVTFDLFVPNIFELASEGDAASLSAEFDARPNRVHEKGPEPFWTALFFACQDGKADTAKVCLERGAEIELIDQLGNTALVYCCYRGDISTFNLFMEYKANVNTKNIVGHTPLIIAATAGQPEILALLLDNGADIDFCDSKNETALIHAIREAIVDLAPQSEAAKVLIHRGADYSLISSDGWQAMHWASYRGLPSIIKTFLSKGVAVDLETQDETTPFMLACKNGKIEVAKLLQSLHADIRHKNVDGKSALTLACCSGKMDMIKWLKSEGLDIFDVTYDGRNNFMWACAHGQIEVARYLRDLGVEIDGDDDDGKNSFHLAMEGDHRPAGKYLLGLGFDVNAPYKAGNALTMAAMKGNFKNAIFLLENKADVNYLFKGKYSPLFYACAEKQWPLVKLLIDYGGDVHYTTPHGFTPMEMIHKLAEEEYIAEMMEKAFADREERLREALLLEQQAQAHAAAIKKQLEKLGAGSKEPNHVTPDAAATGGAAAGGATGAAAGFSCEESSPEHENTRIDATVAATVSIASAAHRDNLAHPGAVQHTVPETQESPENTMKAEAAGGRSQTHNPELRPETPPAAGLGKKVFSSPEISVPKSNMFVKKIVVEVDDDMGLYE